MQRASAGREAWLNRGLHTVQFLAILPSALMSIEPDKLLRSLLVPAAVMALFTTSPLRAQKTDVIVLVNQDRITGEIKSLDRGRLEYSTDDMGTLSIKWDKIIQITSNSFFQVETSRGEKFYGTILEPTDSGTMVMQLIQTYTLPMISVVKINPIKQSFWSGLDGYIDIGASFKKARKDLSLHGAAEVRFRGRKWGFKLNGNTDFQRQDSVPNIRRDNAAVQVERLLVNKWAIAVKNEWSTNSEQSLDLRTQFGLSGIWTGMQTNQHLLRISGGVNLNREQYVGSDTAAVGGEGVVGGDFLAFRFDSPKLDINTSFYVFPSVTDLGRVRMQFDNRVSYELLKDFTVSLTFYDSFDSRPPSEIAAKNDFSVTFGLGWKF